MTDKELPKTKKAARLINSLYFFTGKPCKYGHIARRCTSNNHCYECVKIRLRKYYHKNKV